MRTWSPVTEAKRLFLITQAVKAAMAIVAMMLLTTLGFPLWSLGLLLFPVLMVSTIAGVPWFERTLGRGYLALALGLDVLMTSLQSQRIFFGLGLLWPELADRWLGSAMVEPFLLLLIPLVLTAWAYGRRGALLSSAWAVLLHIGTGIWTLHQGFFDRAAIPGWGGRTLLLFAIPFIVSALARREQRRVRELEEAYGRLQRHAATVEQLAGSRERNRMARDLHDTLAHSLAALSVQLEALRTLIRRDPEAALQAVDEAASLAKSGLEESRQAIGALRSDPVTTLGLVGALRGELRSLEARTGLTSALQVAGEGPDLTDEETQGLFRIVQEALNNAERHASAQQVTLSIAFGSDSTDMTVHDDGAGFDPQVIGDDRYGLTGMQERAAMLGAKLQVHSHAGGGTTVRLSLPRG